MIKLGALWAKGKDKNGNPYMTGILDNDAIPHTSKIPVVLFKNTRKEDEKQPDYYLYLSEPRQDKPKQEDVDF